MLITDTFGTLPTNVSEEVFLRSRRAVLNLPNTLAIGIGDEVAAPLTNYLSIDTEATGLTEECVLIQLAFIPVDTIHRRVMTELGVEYLVKCESYEKLEPTLNPWVKENNEGLIRKAHADGFETDVLREKVDAYLTSAPIQKLFAKNGAKSRPILLGKSLSALDLPLLTRTFGKPFMEKHFHHHTLDITCVTRFLVDAGLLPKGCESTSGLLPHFKVREEVSHTALDDAHDMGQVYLKLLEMGLTVPKTSPV